eukprot:Nk52_evm8s1569 gene=Nk52_evmTU8s1569
MSSWFKKETPEQTLRKSKREMTKTQRGMDRERANLERQEKQLEIDIKAAAKKGDNATAKVLAKQLIKVREQKNKTAVMKSRVAGISAQQQSMHSSHKMAQVMGNTAQAMHQVNKTMDVKKVQKNMMEFEKQNQHMEMTEEMMNDCLDGLDDSDAEMESEDIMNQVLDEIGIEINTKMANAPSVALLTHTQAESSDSKSTDLEARLQGLRG